MGYTLDSMDNETVVVRGSFFGFSAARVVWYLLDLIELLLLVRLLLEFFAANPYTEFTQLIYTWSAGLVAPFANIFPPLSTGPGVLDWAVVLAMLVYWLLAAIIARLIIVLGRTL